MASLDFLTFEEAKTLFTYDPETGIITRNKDKKSKWSVAGNNNFVISIPTNSGYRQLSATRLVFLLMTGKFPIYPVHCKDGNRQNLKWDNLLEGKPGVLVPSKKSGTGVRGIYKIGNSYVIRSTFDNVPVKLSSTEYSLQEMKNIMKSKKLSLFNDLTQKLADQENRVKSSQ
jgi:hypothetical protein